jgi:hypothetical protein
MEFGRRSLRFVIAAGATVLLVASAAEAQSDSKPKLWVDSAAVDTFACAGLSIQLRDYDRDDKWLGHVFQLQVTNRADSSVRYDPTMFAAVLRDGTQQTFPGPGDLTERVLIGYWAKHDLNTETQRERKRAELASRRDLMPEDILPGASSMKRIALGPSMSGGLALGGRGAEQLKEYKASDIPLTLFCRGRRVGVISRPVKG